jgi:hypothetical protein
LKRGRQPHGYYGSSIELQGRQTKAQIEGARYAKRSVFWMTVSVVVLTLASIGSFVLDLFTYWRGGGGG